ncbi:MAG: SRPBCC family protein [bacterium]
MPKHRVTATRRIAAPAPITYAIIADYRDGHPHILPPDYFRNLRVESGGVGAGTVITFDMRVLGSTKPTRGTVAEPSPGRVITEHYAATDVLTEFTVEPAKDGTACDVTIASNLPVHGGLAGMLERAFMNRYLRRAFDAELTLLDTVAQQRSARTRGPEARDAHGGRTANERR